MKLTLDRALALYPKQSSDVRARISMQVFGKPENVALYVRAACRLAADKGLHASAQGALATGDSTVSPDESARRFAQAAATDPTLVKAADSAIKAALDRDQRLAAVVHAVYEAGEVLDLDDVADTVH